MSDIILICDVEGCAAIETADFGSWSPVNFTPNNEFLYMTCDHHA